MDRKLSIMIAVPDLPGNTGSSCVRRERCLATKGQTYEIGTATLTNACRLVPEEAANVRRPSSSGDQTRTTIAALNPKAAGLQSFKQNDSRSNRRCGATSQPDGRQLGTAEAPTYDLDWRVAVQQFTFREIQTPAGVRKSTVPKPAASGPRPMGI